MVIFVFVCDSVFNCYAFVVLIIVGLMFVMFMLGSQFLNADILNVGELCDVVNGFDAANFHVRDTDGLLFDEIDTESIGDAIDIALDHVS